MQCTGKSKKVKSPYFHLRIFFFYGYHRYVMKFVSTITFYLSQTFARQIGVVKNLLIYQKLMCGWNSVLWKIFFCCWRWEADMHPWTLAHESILSERTEAATNVSILRRWVRRKEDNDTGRKPLSWQTARRPQMWISYRLTLRRQNVRLRTVNLRVCSSMKTLGLSQVPTPQRL
jgi:hypothetical protein